MLKSFAVVAVATLAAASVHADVVVSSFPQWDNSSGISTSTFPRAAVGQRFTAPAGAAILDMFATRVNFGNGATGAEVMRMYVYAVSGNSTIGSALFRSEPLTNPGAFSGFVPVVFTGMNVAVTPGQNYVVLFSDAELASHALTSSVTFASTFNSAASSPLLVDIVVSSVTAQPGNSNPLSGTTFSTALAPRDLIVEMTFTPSPAPLSIAAMGALALSRRRR